MWPRLRRAREQCLHCSAFAGLSHYIVVVVKFCAKKSVNDRFICVVMMTTDHTSQLCITYLLHLCVRKWRSEWQRHDFLAANSHDVCGRVQSFNWSSEAGEMLQSKKTKSQISKQIWDTLGIEQTDMKDQRSEYSWTKTLPFSSSRMRVIYHNWSATKQRPHPQSVAEISHHLVLSGDRIRQCETSSGSRHKDTDQCL